MELDFPEGNIYETMSEELQNKFFEKMKNAIWAIRVANVEAEDIGTGFCIDPSGLVVTCAHVIDGDGHVSARRYDDEKFSECRVVFQLPHFDLALLKVYQNSGTSSSSHDGNFNGFDYVKIDDNISRNLPVGIEVFSIGICRQQGFHFVRGVMTYEFEGDNTNYHELAKQSKCEPKHKLTDTSFYNSRKCSVIKGSSMAITETFRMHPDLKYIQISFSQMKDVFGMSGGPFFNSQGKLIGILQCGSLTIEGVSSSALYAFVKCYNDRLG